MKMFCLMTALLLGSAGAEEPGVFQTPKVYDAQRYESGWNKNPFTLKTVAVPSVTSAFAQDLAIGSFYGAVEDPTIVLVNKKTGERFRLKRGESTPGGIRLAEVNVDRGRKETFVQVSQAGETVKLRYDVAVASAVKTPPHAKQSETSKAAPPPGGVSRRLQTVVIHTPSHP